MCRRRLAYLVALSLGAVAACNHPAATTEPNAAGDRAGSFTPTAFSVEVKGHGRPVILIPGLGCPSTVWRDTVAHLSAQPGGYETHTLTLAGFAGAPRIDEPVASTTVRELARYIRDRHLESPVIVGHSLGGVIAYWLAEDEPALVGPTIVVDSDAPAGSDPGSAAAARDRWSRASDDQFAQQVKEGFSQMSAKPARLESVIAEVAKSDRRAMGDAVYETSTVNVRARLDRIQAPVLLVLADGGLQDQFRDSGAKVRNREVVVVPNAKHFVMIDEPDRFFAAVDGFLAKHEPVARR
jgi:N-formylmaleamate deformylase